MKLNKTLFKKIIDLLRSKKVKPSEFDFTKLGSTQDCGCTVHHAFRAGLLSNDRNTYHTVLEIPANDQGIIFGSNEDARCFYFGKDNPNKKFVANFMEDYLIAVEAGMVEGVEA